MTSKSRVGLQQWPLVPTPYVASMPSAPKNDETIVDMSSPYHKSKKRQVPWVPIPSGWKRHVHPSGWIYFEKPEARIITDYPMGSPELQAALNKLDTEDSETIPEEFELWIGQSAQDADIVYIDHERRRALPNLKSDESDIEDHMKTDEDRTKHLRLELSYWRYLAEHPCHARLPPNVEEDALAILSFFIQDRILNPEDSVVPFSKETSKELMDLLSAMTSDKSYASNARNSHVKTHFVSRLMERIVDERLRQHYGEEGARRYLKKGRHARVIQDAKSPWAIDLLLDFCMVFLFFGTPFAYLRHVNEFFITALGRTETISEKWRAFVDENVTDWSDTNLVATVLVSAAVGFLAVPGIDDISRLFALFSILFALSSLIAGLLNAWQHQHESRASLELTIIVRPFQSLGS
ncbi:hypothetical protein SISSUDRAFT_637651 [Sistotremastrum suecicum HHB10207 ss-3]|uniref:WW domain-containing protein n=1 Tax=Sistotremastrum suecicum HHB10207 ss-3 TaxID=1314776 RepID=A0A165X7E6_9AGAM|nr:hypothetical protein SISSUDRAFT_637651 [Sistotremastrum suecicum HHB10207 ss-3]